MHSALHQVHTKSLTTIQLLQLFSLAGTAQQWNDPYSALTAALQASEAATAAKEKIAPTAQAAGPSEDAKDEAAGVLEQAKDKVVSGAQYVSDRCASPFVLQPTGHRLPVMTWSRSFHVA